MEERDVEEPVDYRLNIDDYGNIILLFGGLIDVHQLFVVLKNGHHHIADFGPERDSDFVVTKLGKTQMMQFENGCLVTRNPKLDSDRWKTVKKRLQYHENIDPSRKLNTPQGSFSKPSTCWLCNDWTEELFTYTPGISGPQGSQVWLRLEIDDFKPFPMNLIGSTFYAWRAVPELTPDNRRYFFQVDDNAICKFDNPMEDLLPNCYIRFVLASTGAISTISRVNRLTDKQGKTLNEQPFFVVRPREILQNPPNEILDTQKIKWLLRDSVFAWFIDDASDALSKSFDVLIGKSGVVPLIPDANERRSVLKMIHKQFPLLTLVFRWWSAMDATVDNVAGLTKKKAAEMVTAWNLIDTKISVTSFERIFTLLIAKDKSDKTSEMLPPYRCFF
eukprot:GHVL01028135.1.p1 GENE.GHVL01028135.1~~GHVL01028135.1.p1  ORF type:complete len:389 (+),score=82.75 GHVL01028135.1:1060-2226(+)